MSQQQNWAAYFYPEPYQHVMRNKPGIKDPAALSLYEHRIITPGLRAHQDPRAHRPHLRRRAPQSHSPLPLPGRVRLGGGVPHRGHVQGCECFRERSGRAAEH